MEGLGSSFAHTQHQQMGLITLEQQDYDPDPFRQGLTPPQMPGDHMHPYGKEPQSVNTPRGWFITSIWWSFPKLLFCAKCLRALWSKLNSICFCDLGEVSPQEKVQWALVRLAQH